MRRTPHSIKKDPNIWDMSTGTLKEGYTFHPVNEGYEQVSSIKTQKRTGAGKDGTNWEITGEKPIYKDGPSPKAAPAAAPMPDSVAEEPEENLPIKLSERAAQAKAYTTAYEDKFLPRQGNYTIRDDQSVINDFDNQFKLNLAKARSPQPQEPAVLQNAETKQKQAQVMNYANNYKKAVGDTLSPSNRNIF